MLVCDLEMVISELDIIVLRIPHRLFALDIGNQVSLTGKKYRNAFCVHFCLCTCAGCLGVCVLREGWVNRATSGVFSDNAELFFSFYIHEKMVGGRSRFAED